LKEEAMTRKEQIKQLPSPYNRQFIQAVRAERGEAADMFLDASPRHLEYMELSDIVISYLTWDESTQGIDYWGDFHLFLERQEAKRESELHDHLGLDCGHEEKP
jgi:hypothetical protein